LYFEHPSPELRKATLELIRVAGIGDAQKQRAIEIAEGIAGDKSRTSDKRSEAIAFLGVGDAANHLPLLRSLLDFREPREVQEATSRALSSIPGRGVADDLFARWPSFTAEVRRACIDAMVIDTARVRMLLDSLQAGRISKSAIGAHQATRLMSQRDPYLRRRA